MVEYIPAPTGGWNADATPWELPANQATQLDNFLIRPGKIRMRGGFKVAADLSASAPLNVCGGVAIGNILLARKSLAAGSVDPWNAPLVASTAAALASGLTTCQYVSLLGGIIPITVTADQIPGPRWINFDGLLYGLAYDSTLSNIQDASGSYYMKQCALLTLGQTSPPISVQNYAGAVADNSSTGTLAWSNPNNATVDDFNYATATTASTETTHYLVSSAHGFSIPAGATIQGIQLDVKKQNGGYVGGTQVLDMAIRLVKAGVIQTTDKSHGGLWPSNTYDTYGGPTDLWGTTWTPADVNNAAFGAAISAQVVDMQALVDAIRITVSYTTTSTTPAPTVLANAPHGAVDLAGYLSRVWLLGGIDTPGSGTVHEGTTVFYTNPIVSGGGTATADWKDPVSGLVNKIRLDQDARNYGVALAKVRGALLILRRSSVYVIRGTTTASFTASLVSQETGCIDARSVVEADAGVYFVGAKGLMLTNGTTVVNVSGTVMYTLQQAIAAEQSAVITGAGGYVTCGLTSLGSILVSIGTYSSGNTVPIWCGLYDPSTKTWVRITSQLWASDGIQTSTNYYPGIILANTSPKQLVVVGDKYLTVLEDQNTQFSFLRQTALYDQLPSGGSPFLSIPATWKTRYAPVVGTTTLTRKYGQAKRFFLDYAFGAGGLVPTTGWAVTPVDATDTAYQSATPLLSTLGSVPALTGSVSGVTPQASPRIQRQNQDFANEIEDLGFDVSWSDNPEASQPSNVVADIFGVGVEYQPTRDLR